MSRNILLIGGNSGIGLALAKKLQAKGDQLTVATRSNDHLSTLGIPTQYFDAQEPTCELELPDTLDGVIYCPGSISLKPFHRLSYEDFLNDLQINFFGAVRILQQALPKLKKSSNAAVVLFSTVAVDMGMPFHSSISAAKGAVEGLAKSLAAEWAPNIRVNVIAPSLTDTKLASPLLSDDSKREASAQRHPLKQIGQADDIAELADFLLSSESQFLTGQILRPDGGLSSVRLFS